MEERAGRLCIVGDIHACPAELETLLVALSLQPEDHLVCLGDYIDRGPDAKAVVDLLLGMKAAAVCRCTFLKGNHEDMFLDFLGYDGLYGQSFLMNGGRPNPCQLSVRSLDSRPRGDGAHARCPPGIFSES